MPWHLVESAGVKAEADLPQQFWLTVKVPGDARPGRYTGTVTVKGQTGSAELPFELEVYPFELEEPDATYAHPYNIPNDPNRIEMDLDCMVRYGSNSVTPGIPSGRPTKVDGRLQVDFTRDNIFMEKVRDAGMIGPVPLFNMSIQGRAGGKSFSHMRFERQFSYKLTDQQYLADLTALTKLIVANAKANNWLPVIMYPSTEISSDQRLGPQFNRKLIQAIRAGGEGVRTVSSINRPKDLESVKDLDVVMYNEAVGINTESILAARAEGCDLWFQNIGAGRFNEGLYLLRTGAVGRRQWAMNWYLGNPYCDMYYSSYYRGMQPNTNFLIFPTRTKTIGSIGLARMREGVDDYRYFQTLGSAIAAAIKSGSAAKVALARQAQKQYDVMVASAPVTPPGSYRPGLKPRKVEGEDFENQKLLDDYRRRAAELIMRLSSH